MRYNMHSFHNICKESKELGVISKIHINIDFLMSFFSIDRAIQLENSVNGWMFLDAQASLAPTQVSLSVRSWYFWISIAAEHFCATVVFVCVCVCVFSESVIS